MTRLKRILFETYFRQNVLLQLQNRSLSMGETQRLAIRRVNILTSLFDLLPLNILIRPSSRSSSSSTDRTKKGLFDLFLLNLLELF